MNCNIETRFGLCKPGGVVFRSPEATERSFEVPSAYAKAARVPVVKHTLPALPKWTPQSLPPLPEDFRDDLDDFTRRLAEEAAADRPRELDEDE